jgi:hypothetical protein
VVSRPGEYCESIVETCDLISTVMKYTEVIGFGMRIIGRFQSHYPPTARLYYKPPTNSDSDDQNSAAINNALFFYSRFNSFHGPQDVVEMLQIAG